MTSKRPSTIVVKYEVYYGYETIPGVCGCIKFNAPPRLQCLIKFNNENVHSRYLIWSYEAVKIGTLWLFINIGA